MQPTVLNFKLTTITMHPIRIIITTFSFALLLLSCEKEIEFKGDIAKRKLVLNSDFTPDSSWNVNLSHSLSLGEVGEAGPVTNAVVQIKNAAGDLVTVLEHDSGGIYTSSVPPQAGEVYAIEADASGYDQITANGFAPPQVSISVSDTQMTNFIGWQVFSVDLTIDDPAGVDNYYVIDFETSIYDSLGWLDNFSSSAFSLDPNNDNSELGDENSSFSKLFFKDENFDGQSYTTTLLMWGEQVKHLRDQNNYYYGSGLERVELGARVRSVSKDLYLYLKSYERYVQYSFDPTFSQPVQVYSNIDKGFGIFGGYTSSSFLYGFE